MKKRFLLIGLVLVLVLGASALVGCGSTDDTASTDQSEVSTNEESTGMVLVEPGVLTVGSDCDYPPFIAMEGEQVTGFEYDLLEAMCEEMGLTLKFLPPQNFDSILASVDQGTKMDLGASSFTITPERKELVDFSDPYFDSNQACVAMKDAGFESAMDLDGKKVGSQSGTTGSDWVKENLPNAELVEYNTASDALAALQAGQIEAAFIDEPVAAEMVAKTYTDAEVVAAIPTGEQYGFAVAKSNPGLLQVVNDALATVMNNGTYAEIFARYFDFEPTLP
ncbi:MAG: transporter substrate-binding domain-containing protein [Coriobacteriia bacterium]|nr:transporter substrate-binding domain-containing protein [Coriobacteriia bacterium]